MDYFVYVSITILLIINYLIIGYNLLVKEESKRSHSLLSSEPTVYVCVGGYGSVSLSSNLDVNTHIAYRLFNNLIQMN